MSEKKTTRKLCKMDKTMDRLTVRDGIYTLFLSGVVGSLLLDYLVQMTVQLACSGGAVGSIAVRAAWVW